MIKGCERCRQARINLSVIFVALIVINFVGRTLLNVEVTSLSDVLFLPSLGLLASAVAIYFLQKKFK
tara:strand:- start:219 stop:419 length:201 start_codon:yes stop_codon:yes gene_type:complete